MSNISSPHTLWVHALPCLLALAGCWSLLNDGCSLFPADVSTNPVHQMCPTSMSTKYVQFQCPPFVSTKLICFLRPPFLTHHSCRPLLSSKQLRHLCKLKMSIGCANQSCPLNKHLMCAKPVQLSLPSTACGMQHDLIQCQDSKVYLCSGQLHPSPLLQ